MMKRPSIRSVALTAALIFLGGESVALAASMSGAVRTWNPSAGTVRHKLVVDTTVGTTPGTGMGRGLTVPANVFSFDVNQLRVFPSFPGVAQNTEIATTTHAPLVFRAGDGALGFTSPDGGVTSFTTPTNTTTPTPDILTLKEINWCPRIPACFAFADATVGGARVRTRITPGPNVFGGAYQQLRHIKTGSGAWFYAVGPNPLVIAFNENLRGVVRTTTPGGATNTTNTFSSFWSGGLTNLETVMDINPPNDLFLVSLGGPSSSITNVISSLGPAPTPQPPGSATGFKMTTGTVRGSDATPSTPGGGGFSFTTAGFDDRDASGNGNIQMVGGSVAWGGLSGNTFFRVTRLTMAVPEPGTGLALVAGLGGIAGISAMRRRKQHGGQR